MFVTMNVLTLRRPFRQTTSRNILMLGLENVP